MLKIYTLPEIKPNLNMYIDDLESYLSTASSSATYNDFQYIKHQLNFTIKINIDQSKQADFPYNYVKILNTGDTQAYYYFIINHKWISQSCVSITLLMDTINSLGQGTTSPANPRNFTGLTKITRQHQDRFKKPISWNPATGGTLLRKVNPASEGLNPEKIQSENVSLVSSDKNIDWYLIYRSNGEDAVVIDILASQAVYIGSSSSASQRTYEASDFDLNKYYYFNLASNPNGTAIVDSNTIILGQTSVKKAVTLEADWQADVTINNVITGIVIRRLSTGLQYTFIYNFKHWLSNKESGAPTINDLRYSAWDSSIHNYVSGERVYNGATWKTIPSITIQNGVKFIRSSYDYESASNEALNNITGDDVSIDVGASRLLTLPITSVDRTDSNLIKIIKLPYCPLNYTYSNNTFTLDDEEWQYNSGYIHYYGTGLPTFINQNAFKDNIYSIISHNFNVGEAIDNQSKSYIYESNLYHSDYFILKYIYDNFSTNLALERYDFGITNYYNGDITFLFKPTNTINSKLCFQINDIRVGTYKPIMDYEKYIVVTRNNEETILNSEYINYIKNGYNYDKKQNALQVEQAQRSASTSTIGTAISTVAGIASLALSGATGGASAIAGVSLLAGAVTGGISSANAWQNVNDIIKNQENSMAKNLAQLQAQSASVSGTDDIDLMSFYCNNRLHKMIYEPTEQVKRALYNLYDLTGNSYNRNGTPNVDSRIWYNFVQCTPYLSTESVGKLNQSWLNDLKSRYEAGVTVYHKRNNSWNLLQNYENFEKWIVDGD